MSVRRAIAEARLDGLNVSEFCRQHGISRWLFYELRKRYEAEGLAGLEPRSRAPKRVPGRISVAVEDAIVVLRKELADAGLDHGPATIRFHLPARLPAGVQLPSEATIWRVLGRRGFIVPQPRKAPRHSYRSFTAERANECWQIDDTEWELADATPVKIINIIDDCTRVAVGSKAVPSCTADAAFAAFADAAARWGWPARSLSDNAKAFRHGLASALTVIGVAPGHSRPYHPQTCGKVERFHQTLKRHLAAAGPFHTLAELQTALTAFCDVYNHQRPHRGLNRATPAAVFAATPKTGPAEHPLGQPTSVHRVTVSQGRVNAGAYLISIGAAHDTKTATVILTGTHCHVFIQGHLVRQLELDPTRRTQPLHNRPGRPTNC